MLCSFVSLAELREIADYCHSANNPIVEDNLRTPHLVIAESRGVFGFVFCDFGTGFVCLLSCFCFSHFSLTLDYYVLVLVLLLSFCFVFSYSQLHCPHANALTSSQHSYSLD